jgi:hypothetical protein
MKMRGQYLRDWVKIKAYYYLDWMSKRTTKLQSAGEIARGTNSNYNSLRILLKRWSQPGWAFTKEVDVAHLKLRYRYAYTLTKKGRTRLAYAKANYSFFDMAVEEVEDRACAVRYCWRDEVTKELYYIRFPFLEWAGPQDDDPEDFMPLAKFPKHNKLFRLCANIDEAFAVASKENLSFPPRNTFRNYVYSRVNALRDAARRSQAEQSKSGNPAGDPPQLPPATTDHDAAGTDDHGSPPPSVS